jgi:hypothetical protein
LRREKGRAVFKWLFSIDPDNAILRRAEKRRADVRKAEALLVADAYTITKGHRPVVTVLHNQVGPEGEPLGDWQITIMPLDA